MIFRTDRYQYTNPPGYCSMLLNTAINIKYLYRYTMIRNIKIGMRSALAFGIWDFGFDYSDSRGIFHYAIIKIELYIRCH